MSRYFPAGPDHRLWGLHVFNVGTSSVGRDEPYPVVRHPNRETFDWKHGRILASPKILYITRGEGLLRTREGRWRLVAGDLLCIPPGLWHHYRPQAGTGWDETWFKFEGPLARRLLKRGEFASGTPVHRIGLDREMMSAFDEMVSIAREEPQGFEHLLAAKAIAICSRLMLGGREQAAGEIAFESLVREARLRLLEEEGRITLQDLAKELKVSYSTFRRVFKDHTRISPRQFQLQNRIYQSCKLLTETPLSIKEIAERQGFESVHYFSQIFKRKTGCSPSVYRASYSVGAGVPEGVVERGSRSSILKPVKAGNVTKKT